MHLLTKAKEECDYLFVGLHTDPTIDRPEKNKPLQTSFERYMQLQQLRSVDHIIPYDTEIDLFNLLATLDIQKRFIGSDYMYKSFTGKALCEDRNIEIIYVPRIHMWSSTELRERIKEQNG